MEDFSLWNAPSLQVLRDVELYYVHKDATRLARAFAELVPLNGPGASGWGPLVAFAKAARLVGYPALEEAATQMDVRGYGAQGPNSVNCLWADFYATGDREPILLMIAALPSWHVMRRQMGAHGVVQGAGHSVSWSLGPHLRRHGALRAICKQEALALGQPLQAREELLQALSEVAKYPCEGDEVATPRAITPRDYGPVPDLMWLSGEPPDTWIEHLRRRYPTIGAIEAAITAAEAAGHARDAGLLCATVGYFALAARLLSSVDGVPLIPHYELAMAYFHEALALARAGRLTRVPFERAIAVFDLEPDLVPWLGASLEARIQRALCTKDAADAREALARVDQAATGPHAEPLGTLVTWARKSLAQG
jgi:hypothetical protein